jgi:hypothetical protein
VRERNARQQEQQTFFFEQKSTLASLQLRPIQPKPEQIRRTEHWDKPDRSGTELFREKSRPERDWPAAVATKTGPGWASGQTNQPVPATRETRSGAARPERATAKRSGPERDRPDRRSGRLPGASGCLGRAASWGGRLPGAGKAVARAGTGDRNWPGATGSSN